MKFIILTILAALAVSASASVIPTEVSNNEPIDEVEAVGRHYALHDIQSDRIPVLRGASHWGERVGKESFMS